LIGIESSCNMSAPTIGTVVTGGGRFQSTADADPATVLAAVRSGIFQVCKEQISAEVKRLQLVRSSGSPSEAAAAVRAASLVVDEAAEVVAEADAVLRLRGLADDDATGWSSRRDLLELHIKQSRILMAAMERVPPESRRTLERGLIGQMSLIRDFAYNWCRWPPPTVYRAPPTSTTAVVDDLASGIEAVRLSAQE
jgi:hypothetical protein